MKKCYVITGRTTFFERNAYAATETYTWNEPKKRIDVLYECKVGSFAGKRRRMPQKAWVESTVTQAHWACYSRTYPGSSE